MAGAKQSTPTDDIKHQREGPPDMKPESANTIQIPSASQDSRATTASARHTGKRVTLNPSTAPVLIWVPSTDSESSSNTGSTKSTHQISFAEKTEPTAQPKTATRTSSTTSAPTAPQSTPTLTPQPSATVPQQIPESPCTICHLETGTLLNLSTTTKERLAKKQPCLRHGTLREVSAAIIETVILHEKMLLSTTPDLSTSPLQNTPTQLSQSPSSNASLQFLQYLGQCFSSLRSVNTISQPVHNAAQPESSMPGQSTLTPPDIPPSASTSPDSSLPECAICTLLESSLAFADTVDRTKSIGQSIPVCTAHPNSVDLHNKVKDIFDRLCDLQWPEESNISSQSQAKGKKPSANQSQSGHPSLCTLSKKTLQSPAEMFHNDEIVEMMYNTVFRTAFDLGSVTAHYGTAKSSLSDALTALCKIDSMKDVVLLKETGLGQLKDLATQVSQLATKMESRIDKRLAEAPGDKSEERESSEGKEIGKGKKKEKGLAAGDILDCGSAGEPFAGVSDNSTQTESTGEATEAQVGPQAGGSSSNKTNNKQKGKGKAVKR